ncbi:MAG: YceD family protein [Planctomycetota bacterium]
MRILFDAIPEIGSLNVECFAGSEELRGLVGEGSDGVFGFDSPVKGLFAVSRKGRKGFVEFESEGSLDAVCSRCLVTFPCPIKGAGRLVLFPEGEDSDEAFNGELDKDYYDGRSVDLGVILAEEVALVAPVTPLCSTNCKGLCYLCGQNLNDGECGCSRTPCDERLSILKNIKF